jgi:hypothetical protein
MAMPISRARVVCGLPLTIATFWPTSAFTSVDLPAFGAPITATNPAFCSPSREREGVGGREASLNAPPLTPPLDGRGKFGEQRFRGVGFRVLLARAFGGRFAEPRDRHANGKFRMVVRAGA